MAAVICAAIIAPGSSFATELADATIRADAEARLRLKSQTAKRSAEDWAKARRWTIRGAFEGRGYELMRIENGRPVYYATQNKNAAISAGVNLIRQTAPYSLDGQDQTAGVWDEGIPQGAHVEFSGGRITVGDSSTTILDHVTHVAGTLGAGGVDINAMGMAPAVAILAFDWTDDTAEMTSKAMATPGETGKIAVSNHSYGEVCGWSYGNYSGGAFGPHWFGILAEMEDLYFGQYNGAAVDWDTVCHGAPYFLPFTSAGNDRSDLPPGEGVEFFYLSGSDWQTALYDSAIHPPSDGWDNGGFDTITREASAKNIMTVGAVNDAVADGSRDISAGTMANFSGWGPTDDGRIKPDIVANGVDVYSPLGYSNTAYASFSGTSMACPSAAGAAVLLAEYYAELFSGGTMRASTIKGLMIHTADDLGPSGPDYQFGWGLVDAKAAADQIKGHSDFPGSFNIVEDTLDGGSPTSGYALAWDGLTPLRATRCWTDPPGTARAVLDDTTPNLVNDLDIRLTGPGGPYLPYTLNPSNPLGVAAPGDNVLDNVEQILVSASTVGTYTLTVSHKGSLSGGSQTYSLLLSGQAVDDLAVSPPDDLNSGGEEAGPFAPSSKTYTLTNVGSQSITYGADKSASWLTLSSSGGTIDVAGSVDIDVTINSNADALPAGVYQDTITFSRSGSAIVQERTVTLTITHPPFYFFSMDSDPGWTTQGQWAFGQPTGGGSGAGDPESGYTGSNVYGYNLDGDYENDLIVPQTLQTGALDCTGYSDVKLTFWRWLGVESSPNDHVSIVVANGAARREIWSNRDSDVSDAQWVYQEFDISDLADDQATVYIEWTMGPTNDEVTFPGWNIDDVSLYGIPPIEYGEIEVTDTVEPLDNLDLPFGYVRTGQSATESITVSNADATNNLIVSDVRLGGMESGYLENLDDGLAQDWIEIPDRVWEVVIGEYRATTETLNQRMQSTYSRQRWGDCTVQATMRRDGQLSGAAWLFWRATDDFSYPGNAGSAYGIGISGDGRFFVSKFVNGQFSFLNSGPEASPFLNTSIAPNTVKAVAEGASIEVYLNGNLAWSGSDTSLTEAGRIAIAGDSGSTRQTIHYFDDITVFGPGVTSAPRQSRGSRGDAELDSVSVFLLGTLPDFPVVLTPSQSFSFDVTYEGTLPGSQTGAVTISSNDENEPQVEVTLTGTNGTSALHWMDYR